MTFSELENYLEKNEGFKDLHLANMPMSIMRDVLNYNKNIFFREHGEPLEIKFKVLELNYKSLVDSKLKITSVSIF